VRLQKIIELPSRDNWTTSQLAPESRDGFTGPLSRIFEAADVGLLGDGGEVELRRAIDMVGPAVQPQKAEVA